jgi:hypothetical protein
MKKMKINLNSSFIEKKIHLIFSHFLESQKKAPLHHLYFSARCSEINNWITFGIMIFDLNLLEINKNKKTCFLNSDGHLR